MYIVYFESKFEMNWRSIPIFRLFGHCSNHFPENPEKHADTVANRSTYTNTNTNTNIYWFKHNYNNWLRPKQ